MSGGATLAAVAAVALVAGVLMGLALRALERSRRTAAKVALPPASFHRGTPDGRFDQLMRSITVGVVVVDRNGQIASLNAAAGAVFAIGSRPALGRAIIEVIPSFDLDRRVREAVAGNPSRGTVAFGGAREPRTLTVTTVPLDADAGAIVIATDETRLHELERTRREFISSVSHELRTPLSSIKLMTETLLDRHGDDEARELFLPRIKQEVDRMVQLVEDLLELARAESGRMRLRREPLDLTDVAASALRGFEQRANQLDVRLELSGKALGIVGDSARLTQVVVNLVDNALRHTPAGGVVGVAVSRSGGDALLVVRDDGDGIPYRDLPHIFERFYVVDRSRAREAGGTGLGLSIVKQIVEAHGGDVGVESELGVGTTFSCRLPAGRA
jgi:signal transduction histidine kinase